MRRIPFILLAVLLLPSVQAQAQGQHENLNSVLYVQTSIEYAATTTGLYELAKLKLDHALQDPAWTAAVEQIGQKGYSKRPPAVILDVDETVLSNSPYQARLIEDGSSFNSNDWSAWVDEGRADPIAGALDFTRYAASVGVMVFYVTNRAAQGEKATRKNLQALGFPVDENVDTILTKGEKPGWAKSDKTPRREFVAHSYRILLLIGDNYGDFSSDSAGSLDERAASAQNYLPFWGEKWIMIPNPLYGSWEGAVIGYRYGASTDEKLRVKHEHLRTAR